MADRATGEFLVIAVLPQYEGKGIGGRLMIETKKWLTAAGCTRAWLTTDLDTGLRAYGFYAGTAGPTGRSKGACVGWRSSAMNGSW
jgi:GNAT superfamily N-acetyltransferase